MPLWPRGKLDRSRALRHPLFSANPLRRGRENLRRRGDSLSSTAGEVPGRPGTSLTGLPVERDHSRKPHEAHHRRPSGHRLAVQGRRAPPGTRGHPPRGGPEALPTGGGGPLHPQHRPGPNGQSPPSRGRPVHRVRPHLPNHNQGKPGPRHGSGEPRQGRRPLRAPGGGLGGSGRDQPPRGGRDGRRRLLLGSPPLPRPVRLGVS